MNLVDEEAEVRREEYGAGWIEQNWLWACDDCLNDARNFDDVALLDASCGNCDTVHEARAALMQHNVDCHGGRTMR